MFRYWIPRYVRDSGNDQVIHCFDDELKIKFCFGELPRAGFLCGVLESILLVLKNGCKRMGTMDRMSSELLDLSEIHQVEFNPRDRLRFVSIDLMYRDSCANRHLQQLATSQIAAHVG